MKPNFVILILTIGLFAGCARFQPQPLSPEQTAAQLDARRLDDPGLKQFLEKNLGHELEVWPLESWDLNSLTLAAFYFHPDLDVARAQWRVAEAGVKTAGARPNPSVTRDARLRFRQIPGNYSPWLVPVTFDMPIETAGKRAKRIAEAQDVVEVRVLEFDYDRVANPQRRARQSAGFHRRRPAHRSAGTTTRRAGTNREAAATALRGR